MLRWLDIIKFTNKGNLSPDFKVEKSNEQWKAILAPDVYEITRNRKTERAFSSEMCTIFEPGNYQCVCCGNPLFDGNEKYESGSGWPSFTQPIKDNAIAYIKDKSHGMYRVETICNNCDSHLGHVFQDGPEPSGLRYCMNALALKKTSPNTKKLVLGGGCFWCTEAVFLALKGVIKVVSGYSGGHIKNPTYREVISGLTNHAEVIEITYNPEDIKLKELIMVHLTTHDPTTLNQQGADKGTQYRSIVFYHTLEEKNIIEACIAEAQEYYPEPIVTEVVKYEMFYQAEQDHQNFYNEHSGYGYCTIVIDPKLNKLRSLHKNKLK